MKLLLIIIVAIFVPWAMGVVCAFSNGRIFGKLFHKTLGWHFPSDEPQTFDGVNFKATCRFCGKEILQDSQGNWFTIE